MFVAVEAPGEHPHTLLGATWRVKTVKKTDTLRGSHFHFMVHPTGAVSVVAGSLPSRTASRASMK